MIPNSKGDGFARLHFAINLHQIKISLRKRSWIKGCQESATAFIATESADFKVLRPRIILHGFSIQLHDTSQRHVVLGVGIVSPMCFCRWSRRSITIGCKRQLIGIHKVSIPLVCHKSSVGCVCHIQFFTSLVVPNSKGEGFARLHFTIDLHLVKITLGKRSWIKRCSVATTAFLAAEGTDFKILRPWIILHGFSIQIHDPGQRHVVLSVGIIRPMRSYSSSVFRIGGICHKRKYHQQCD